MSAVYFHIPFCRKACHYCDFHFSTKLDDIASITFALLTELNLRADYLKESDVSTIYFGGGTPGILPVEDIELLINGVKDRFALAKDVEITLEANPEDVTLVLANRWAEIGVNRISLGIQTFDDKVLANLNRSHSGQQAKDAVRVLRQAGFANITIDLMYGLPGVSLSGWKEDVEQAIALGVPHISSYHLTIEDKTVFGHRHRKGTLAVPEDDLASEQLLFLIERLTEAGYLHYEISNFAKPGFNSRHNSNYWMQGHYLGIGPSAHSFNGNTRQFNVANNARYKKGWLEGKPEIVLEKLKTKDLANDYLLTTIRTDRGCDFAVLASKYGYQVDVVMNREITHFINEGMAVQLGSVFKLTNKGKLWADYITRELMLD